MKIGFKIALSILALVVGAGLGQAHKHIRIANADARLAQEQSARDARGAEACRDAGGMPIYSIIGRLAGCYKPPPKK
jgi:hypothetical protein